MSSNRCPEEFPTEAITQIIDRGYSVQEFSQRLGFSTHTLYKSLKVSGRQGDRAQGEKIDAIRQENLRLKAELKWAEEERDVLQKAAGYFAKTSG